MGGSSPAEFAGQSPVPGMRMVRPARRPRRDDVLMGYEVVHPVTGCCECEGLTLLGQVAVICLAITLPCFSCLPCCMQECHERYQRPVYGKATAEGAPVTYPRQEGPPVNEHTGLLVTGTPLPKGKGK